MKNLKKAIGARPTVLLPVGRVVTSNARPRPTGSPRSLPNTLTQDAISQHWICQKCKKPIGGNGFVEIFNANPALGPVGSYPVQRSPDFDPREVQDAYIVERELATIQREQQMQTEEAVRFLDRPINIGFGVFHTECSPYSDLMNYHFPAEDNMESLVTWVIPAGEDVVRAARYRGAAPLLVDP